MERLAAATLIAILGVAALLALPLVREGFWCDEAFSIEIARSPSAAQFFHDIRIGDWHPPLFVALLAAYGRALHWQEVPMKLVALFFGLMSIAGIATLGRELRGNWAGVLAAAIALHSPLITSHVAEARSYALSVAFLTFGIAALARASLRSGGRSPEIAAFILLVLAAWTHYVALFAIAAAGALAAIYFAVARIVAARSVAIINLAAAATALPLLPLFLPQLTVGIPYEHPRTTAENVGLALHKIRYALPHADFAPVPAAALALLAICVIALMARQSLQWSFVAMRGELALVATYLVPVFAVFGPIGEAERYVITGAALTCVVAALLVVALDEAAQTVLRLHRPLRVVVAAYFVLSLGSVIASAPEIIGASRSVTKSGARSFAARVQPTARDVIVAAPDVLAATIDYYAQARPTIVGYPQWERPEVTDTPARLRLWTDARVAAESAAKLDALIRAKQPQRVFIVSGRIGVGIPLYEDERIARFLREVAKRGELVPAGMYTGRVETLYVFELRTSRR